PEHDPTPIPATRRIVRPRMQLTPTPPCPPAPLPARPDAQAMSGVIPDPTAADPGPPTVRLTRPPEPPAPEPSPPAKPVGWWAFIFRLVSNLLRRRKPGRGTDVKSSPD